MQKRPIILVWIFLFSFCPPPSFFLHPTQALVFTASDYWFFINDTGVIDYDEMYFTVTNGEEKAIDVVCSYDKPEGVEVSITFDWTNITLYPMGKVKNHYQINVSSVYQVTFILKIYIRHRLAWTPDAQLSSGGVITNKITFYSAQEGGVLNLRVVDQSDAYRDAQVRLKYKVNQSFGYSPIKEFNGSRLYGVFPLGSYHVQAWDRETGIYGEKVFEITSQNQTDIDVILTLVGFGRFKLESRGVLGVNATINNYVGDLLNLRIYAQLLYETKLVTQTPETIFSYFPKTQQFELMLWFDPVKWRSGRYTVKGIIEASGVIIATKTLSFSTTGNADEFSSWVITILGVGVVVGVAIAIFIRREIIIRRQLKQIEGLKP